MTAKILLFPASRIARASAEIFARRTAHDWAVDEPNWAEDERRTNKILAEMAGNPLPRLGITRIYDLDKDTLLDIAEQLHCLTARLMDYVERDL